MKLVSGDPAKMTVLHAGYVLQQCFDVALPAHRDPRRPLAPVPACKFLDGVTEPADWGIEFRGAAKLDAVGHEPAAVARACSPVYLLGSPKLTWLPRRIDAWACAPCSRHIHGTHASTAIIVAAVLNSTS